MRSIGLGHEVVGGFLLLAHDGRWRWVLLVGGRVVGSLVGCD